MQLDYISKINGTEENIIRLYDFDRQEAEKFRDLLSENLIINKDLLSLDKIDFIKSRNCHLIFRLSEEDLGMVTINEINFYCDLTTEGYLRMLDLLEPFCRKETQGYQWLYDIDNPTDFLFSPAGSW